MESKSQFPARELGPRVAPQAEAEARSGTRASLLAFASVLLPLLLFGALAEDVWKRDTFGWDSPALQWLHAHSSPFLDALMLQATLVGGAIGMLPLAALGGLGLWLGGRQSDALFEAVGVGGACVIDLIAKAVFERARPSLWPSLSPEHDYGFPSGHSVLSSAVVAVLLLLLWRSRAERPLQVLATAAGVAFVLLVGASRLYLGVHYPSDVLAGWAASLAWVGGAYHLLLAPGQGVPPALKRARQSLRREA